jgi:hypothetical protein
MAALSGADVQSLADSLAKHITDAFALISGSQSAIVTGQGTTLGKVAAFNDSQKQLLTLDGINQAMKDETSFLNGLTYNSVLDAYFWAMVTLDKAVPSGLAAFLQAQAVQVDPHFLDAFNRAFSRQVGSIPVAKLGAFQAFGQAIALMGSVAVTGANTGNFVDSAAQAAAYGNAPLSIFNNGGGVTGAQSTVFTVTYNKYDGSGNLVTGQTATATMPNGSAVGFAVALSGSAAGIDITNIAVTSNGNNGDNIGVKATLLRAVAY